MYLDDTYLQATFIWFIQNGVDNTCETLVVVSVSGTRMAIRMGDVVGIQNRDGTGTRPSAPGCPSRGQPKEYGVRYFCIKLIE